MSSAADLTDQFVAMYDKKPSLSATEKASLKNVDFYLVPGIMAESFRWDDGRSVVDFSVLTRSYFNAQKKLLKKNGFSVKVLKSSSYSVAQTKKIIAKAIAASVRAQRKAMFMTHSLGGLALLEELLQNESLQTGVRGVLFLQSPFAGSPMADIYMEGPYYTEVWLKPLLPFFNTSDETVDFLSRKTRSNFMEDNRTSLERLINKLPIITVGGVVNGSRSLFRPTVDVLAHGCVMTLGVCTTRELYSGPYDVSDGLVPFESSRILHADFIKLAHADHGELVLNVPFESYDKKNLTISLLKLLLAKTNQ